MLKWKKTIFLLIALSLLILSGLVFADESYSTRYFRQLVYNHVSPHIPMRGIYEITAEAAENRTFYNKENQPVVNIKGVFKEEYTYDADGFKSSLKFYDQKGQPMESNWNIASYQWEKHQGLVVERRYNLKGELVKISPYFDFLITGIKYNEQGFPMANYNLSETLEIKENNWGVASYQDKYDQNGNHIEYAYYNKDNQLTPAAYGFAVGRKTYDSFGNVTKEEYLGTNLQHLREITFQYDENGWLK